MFDAARLSSLRKRAAMAGTVATLALLVTACSSGGSPSASNAPKSKTSSTTAATPRYGGTVVDALGPVTGFDWYLPLMAVAYNSTTNATAQSLQYKGLYVTGSNGMPDYARSIASDITWNKAGTVYTVKMNPKWKWSNGRAVTAQDVAFDWQMIQAASSPTAPAPWPWTGAGPESLPTLVKTFTVVNSHEFQVTTKQAVNQLWFMGQLGNFTPFPKAAWDKYPTNPAQELAYLTQNGSNPSFFSVIDGPFKLIKAVPEQSWTFAPNPRYSGHQPYLHRLVFQYETSDSAEVSGLQTGAVQVGYLPGSDYAIRNTLTLDRFVAQPAAAFGRVMLNFKNPQVGAIFKNRVVREAMQMGIDQPTIIKAIFNGLGVQNYGPVVSMSPYRDPNLEHPVYPYNPAAGKALLEKNGFHLVNGVMQNAQGQQLAFTMDYPTGSTSTLAMVQLLSQDWGKEGIKVSLNGVPFPTMLQDHRQPTKWQMQGGLLLTGGIGYQIDNTVFASDGPLNFVGYSNTQLDQLMAKALEPQPSTAAALQANYAYQEFVAKHLPNLWMPVGDSFSEVATNVHGVFSSVPVKGSYAIYPQYWWVGK
jgi:peptide/nickel transport system substrate-binding protein